MIFRFFEVRRKSAGSQSPDVKDEKSKNDYTNAQDKTDGVSIDLKECDVCGAWFSGEVCERKGCQK